MGLKLSAAYLTVALKMQEAADLSAGDIGKRLSDAIQDAHRGTGSWGYYIDHFGDSESGDVIYSCDGDTMKAPYSISATGGAATCVIDMDQAQDVVPRTVYEPEAEEDDHYAAMEESYRRDNLYSALPLYERFISKKERDAASSEDFAGKGKSFPILKPEDVTAAAHAMGRAGSGNLGPSGIKARIIAIAKRKGWTKYLPKTWQGDSSDAKESGVANSEGLHLVESAATVEAIHLRESRADYEIKLIAPGKGSSAFYPAEVLKRDGPQVFRSNTHIYLNHPTAAEEAARPEGDVSNLAGVLTTDAVYHESHPKGEGLYARMKVFADHAQMVEEKAPHVGMSIRANGDAVMEGKRPVMRDGVPVLAKLTSAESVDVVTRPGAGGMILTEAARPQTQQEDSMDAAELTKLKESIAAQEAVNRQLLERAIRGDAREEAARILGTMTLHEALKSIVVENVIERGVPQKDGALDTAKFTEAVNAEAKRIGAAHAAASGTGQVRGLGGSVPTETDPVKLAEARKREEESAAQELKESESVFARLMGNSEAAKRAAMKGRAA